MRSSSSGRNFGGGSSDLGSRNLLLPHDDQVDACGQAAELRQCLHLKQLRQRFLRQQQACVSPQLTPARSARCGRSWEV